MNAGCKMPSLRRYLPIALAALAAPSIALDSSDFATPKRAVDFLHMDLRLTMTTKDIKTRQMHGVATYHVRVKEAAEADSSTAYLLKTLALEAVGLNIGKVELAPGARRDDPDFIATTYESTAAQLIIDLEPRMSRGSEFLVRITYTARRARLGLHFVLPTLDQPDKPTMVYSHAEPLQARYWLPCHDWPDTRWPSDVFITVPQPYRAVCVGEPVGEPVASVRSDEPLRTYHWRQSEPIDSHMFGFAVGELTVTEDEWRGRPVLVYAHPKYKDAARYTFRRTADMLEFYSKLTGVDYPFPRFSHVVIEDHFHGGMEHIGMDFLKPAMLTRSDRNGDVLLDGSQFNYIAHMLAHQWFGGMANYQRITEAWLNEGFGTYLHQLWRSQAYSYDPSGDEDTPNRVSEDWFNHEMWRTARRIALRDRPGSAPLVNEEITGANQIYGFGGGKIYWKGAWVLHMLRHQLGDETFWNAIREYLTRHRGLGVETADLRGALEAESKRDLKPFFDQWVYRGGAPHLRITYSWDQERKKATVTVKQTQRINDENPPFQFPLDLHFLSSSAEREETVAVTEAEQEFQFDFQYPPSMMCVDPRGGLLKSLRQSKPLDMWLEQARHGPTSLSRAIAIDHLGSEESDEIEGVLNECLADEKLFWGARQRAADLLGDYGTRASLESLLSLSDRSRTHPRVLASVLKAISGRSSSKRAHAALLRHAGSESHMRPRSAAIRGLTRCRADESLASDTVRALERAALPPNGRYVRSAAIRALRRVNDAQTVDVLLTAVRSPTRGDAEMRTLLIARLSELAGEYDRHRTRVADYLVDLLDGEPVAVRAAAITGLGIIGDESIVALLEPLAGDDQPRSIRRAARSSIEAIQENGDK